MSKRTFIFFGLLILCYLISWYTVLGFGICAAYIVGIEIADEW